MDNYFPQTTDPFGLLRDQGWLPPRGSFIDGRGAIGAIYWKPAYLAKHSDVISQAKALLLSPDNQILNPETGQMEIPWDVVDRSDMMAGRPDLNLEPMEMYNPYFVNHGVWPDLVLMMKPGWQLKSSYMFNAGHGSAETKDVVLAIQRPNLPSSQICSNPVQLADIAVTIAHKMGLAFPFTAGQPLTCEAAL